MSEPGLLSTASAQQQDSLWETAPGWRRLTIAASLLTLAAVATPLLLPQTDGIAAHPQGAPRLESVAVTPPVVAPQPAAPLAALPPAHVAYARTALAKAHPAEPAQACALAMPPTPRQMSGTVIGFIDHGQSLRIFANTGRNAGGTVNPTYVDDVRVMVRPDPGANGGSRNPVVPKGVTVAVRDHVTYVSPSRDPSMSCGFIPSHVMADLGPAKTDTAETSTFQAPAP